MLVKVVTNDGVDDMSQLNLPGQPAIFHSFSTSELLLTQPCTSFQGCINSVLSIIVHLDV